MFRKDIEVDGQDSTDKIVEMVEEAKQKDHIKAVVLDGITFGGFNTADIKEIKREIGNTVIAVNRDRPDFRTIERAAGERDNGDEIMEAVESAGKVFEKELEQGRIYFQYAGADREEVESILDNFTEESSIPEPVRAAHLIASGVKTGSSSGGR